MTPALLIAALAVAPVSAPVQESGPIYAIAVGYNGAAQGLPELHYADDDALRFALLFRGITAPENVLLLTEIDAETAAMLGDAGIEAPSTVAPTRSHLFEALAQVSAKVAASGRTDATLFFFYAGHGLTGRLLLQPEGAPEAAITGHELRSAIAALPVSQASVFVDSCRAQSLFVERGAAGPDLSAEIDALERRTGTARIGVLAAATSDHPAGEAPQLRAGFFSYVLESGLAGAADADGDGVVTFGELAAFVAFNTQAASAQRPWFDPPGGDLHATAIDHRSHRTRLAFAEGERGRFRVETPTGLPVFAEFNKPPGSGLNLVLPPGRYQVVRFAPAGDQSAVVELDEGRETNVTASTFLSSSQGALRGDENSEPGFGAPFTREVVSTLSVGYQSGREPTATSANWRHAIALAYGAGPAPFGLAGVEQGGEVDYRFALGRVLAGIAADFRFGNYTGQQGPFGLRRTGVFLDGGVRYLWPGGLEITGALGAGLRAVLHEQQGTVTSGDLTAPGGFVDIRAEYPLPRPLAVFLDVRAEADWVNVAGVRQPFFEPTASLGIAARL